jgi:hypothetical protein
MTNYLFEQPNLSAGLDDALISSAHSVPAFPIMILVFIFFTILLGGSTAQKRRTGSPDIPMWSAMAGLSTTFVALIMTIGTGMIDLVTLGIVIAITIMCGFWFFMSKVKGEQ